MSFLRTFLATAETHAQRPAVTAAGAAVDYGALAERSLAFAGFLQSEGLAAGDRVGIVLDASPDFATAYYGTLLAGGMAVPLNPGARGAELGAWLRHADTRWAVCDAAAPQVAAGLASLESAKRVLHAGSGVAPDGTTRLSDVVDAMLTPHLDAIDVDAPATILYTSGTTGRPKGVTLARSALDANYGAIVRYLRLSADDSIVTVLPCCYSYGASVLHTHLRVGAHVVAAEGFVYPHVVVGDMAARRVTGFAGVPSTYALLLARVQLADFDLSSLRYLTQAGGPMSPALTRRVRAAFPRAALYVMYGQTEATARLAYVPPESAAAKEGAVGVPVEGVEVEVRDEQGARLPTDAVGAIWVRGANVMLGYWRDPETTSSVLRDGWLCTGDMGRVDADGFLHVVGRRSDIIKVGAHRVHPGDVETAIAELDGVAEVAVVGVDDELLGEQIRAFVVPVRERAIDPMKVRQHCRARLANYKVPKYVDVVADLPKTPGGKISRVALRSMPPPEATRT